MNLIALNREKKGKIKLKMSNILIIGNGFDIYHGLPTRYNDFLFLAENWDCFIEKYNHSTTTGDNYNLIDVRLDNGCLSNGSLEDFALNKNIFNEANIKYLNDNIGTNAWIKYFLKIKFNGKGWVDFEAEIEKVLHDLEYFFNILPNHAGSNIIASKEIDSGILMSVRMFLPLIYDRYQCNYFGVIRASDVEPSKLEAQRLYLIEKLKIELNVLIECLGIYLLEFVESIKCNVYSEQVKELGSVKLLNFNYTYTHKKVYGNLRSGHHPIHGDCLNGGMVLGIPDDAFEDKLEYIYFVKYFQRIQKRAGNFYKDWINEPSSETQTLSDVQHQVYIMGHSLAYTDKGVLQDFFKNDWVSKITIFYHNQDAYENMVINLVRMFGKDFVIEQIGIERICFEKLEPAVVGDGRVPSC